MSNQTKQEKLQALWDSFAPQSDEYHRFQITYRPNDGWYAVPEEPRHFDDKGEYLGATFDSLNSPQKIQKIVSRYF